MNDDDLLQTPEFDLPSIIKDKILMLSTPTKPNAFYVDYMNILRNNIKDDHHIVKEKLDELGL